MTGQRIGTPKRKSPVFNTLDEVRIEMSMVYREARRGRVDVSDASRLVYMLKQIADMIEAGEFERRIQALEAVDGIGPYPQAPNAYTQAGAGLIEVTDVEAKP